MVRYAKPVRSYICIGYEPYCCKNLGTFQTRAAHFVGSPGAAVLKSGLQGLEVVCLRKRQSLIAAANHPVKLWGSQQAAELWNPS